MAYLDRMLETLLTGPDGLHARIAALIAERGRFAKLGWAELSRGTGLPLDHLLALIPDRVFVFDAAFAVAERAALAIGDPTLDPDWDAAPPRDRLFEILASRLDGLAEWRPALRVAAQDPDPRWVAHRLRCEWRFCDQALGRAGVEGRGLPGLRSVIALQQASIRAYRIWLTDNSADLGPTLNALDTALTQASGQFQKSQNPA